MSRRGTYALIMSLPRACRIRIGALGTFDFRRGNYVYIGSALNGLDARIARHLAGFSRRDLPEGQWGEIGRRVSQSRPHRVFWHIDYFLPHARILQVWTDATGVRLECEWAHTVLALPNARVLAPRFGASDCDCAAHLVFLDRSPAPNESDHDG